MNTFDSSSFSFMDEKREKLMFPFQDLQLFFLQIKIRTFLTIQGNFDIQTIKATNFKLKALNWKILNYISHCWT